MKNAVEAARTDQRGRDERELKNGWWSARGNGSAALFRAETGKAMVQFGLGMKRIERADERRQDDRMVFK
jgi:hypothetical protein